jgi:hypothetical protein
MKLKEMIVEGIRNSSTLFAGLAYTTAGIIHSLTVLVAFLKVGIGAGVLTCFLPFIAEGYWFFWLGPLSRYGITLMIWIALVIFSVAGFILSSHLE